MVLLTVRFVSLCDGAATQLSHALTLAANKGRVKVTPNSKTLFCSKSHPSKVQFVFSIMKFKEILTSTPQTSDFPCGLFCINLLTGASTDATGRLFYHFCATKLMLAAVFLV